MFKRMYVFMSEHLCADSREKSLRENVCVMSTVKHKDKVQVNMWSMRGAHAVLRNKQLRSACKDLWYAKRYLRISVLVGGCVPKFHNNIPTKAR